MEKVEGRRNAFAPAAGDVTESSEAGVAFEARRPLLYLFAGAALTALVFWYLQFSTRAICCGDLDGYYHMRWSRLLWEGLRQGSFPPRFTWLPLTTLNPQDYVDHHLLFHVLQIPFTWFGDMRLGAKISAALFASLAVISCYWLTLRHRVSYPVVWLFALLGCSAPFLYRMNMAKAMSVTIVLLIAGLHLLFTRRYLWLLPLAFVFTLTYDMFALLLLAAGVWTVALLWTERRVEWRPLAWTIVGVAAGLVINPYFPLNAKLFAAHVLMKVTASDFATEVGQEWYPYDSWVLFKNNFVAFAAMLAGYIAFDPRERERDARPLFFLIFSTALLVANARWRRFAEYWPPFAVLFAAFSLRPLLGGARAKFNELPADVLDDLQPFLDRQERADAAANERERELWRTAAAGFVALLLAVSAFFTVRAERSEIRESAPPEAYAAGAEWMRRNVPPGEIVFNTDWDDFPKLFYYDPTHAYVSGLDPNYLHDRDRDLSKLYEEITLGRERDPGPLIRERFGARYVFTDNEDVHNDFYDKAMDSGWFEEVYTDEHCTILRIRDERGEPADEDEPTDEGAESE